MAYKTCSRPVAEYHPACPVSHQSPNSVPLARFRRDRRVLRCINHLCNPPSCFEAYNTLQTLYLYIAGLPPHTHTHAYFHCIPYLSNRSCTREGRKMQLIVLDRNFLLWLKYVLWWKRDTHTKCTGDYVSAAMDIFPAL